MLESEFWVTFYNLGPRMLYSEFSNNLITGNPLLHTALTRHPPPPKQNALDNSGETWPIWTVPTPFSSLCVEKYTQKHLYAPTPILKRSRVNTYGVLYSVGPEVIKLYSKLRLGLYSGSANQHAWAWVWVLYPRPLIEVQTEIAGSITQLHLFCVLCFN